LWEFDAQVIRSDDCPVQVASPQHYGRVMTQPKRYESFLALHQPGSPLLLANAWDVGSARLLAACGFAAIATTSSGYAASLGRLDGELTREESLDHAAYARGCYGPTGQRRPRERLRRLAAGSGRHHSAGSATGVAGASIEDYTRDESAPIYDIGLARDRVAAAVEAAHSGPSRLVLTARAENYLHGRADLGDTIERLQAVPGGGCRRRSTPRAHVAGRPPLARGVRSTDR
jgi:hypothetical protein